MAITESMSSLLVQYLGTGTSVSYYPPTEEGMEDILGQAPHTSTSPYALMTSPSGSSTLKVWAEYSFDTSSVPSNATDIQVICETGGRTNPVAYGSLSAQLYCGNIAKGTSEILTTQTIKTLNGGTWTREELSSCKIRYTGSNSKSYKVKYFMYPSRLTVTYTYQNEHFMLKSGGTWGEVSKVFKKISGAWVEQTTLTGLISSDAMLVKGAGLSFLYTDPIVPFTLENVHIPGVVYSSSTGYYYSVGSSSTSLIDDCYYYMLNSSLAQARSDTITFNSTALFSHYPSSIELHQNGYIFVGFNGNDQDVTLNRSIFRTTPAPSTSASISGNAAWRNNDTQYQINASAVSSTGNIFFYGNYNNSTLSGSGYYTSAYTSAGSEPSLHTMGLGNISGHSPIISATAYQGYPFGLTKNTRYLFSSSPSSGSDFWYNQLSTTEEGVSISTAGDYLVACTKTSSGTYKIYYSNKTDVANLKPGDFSTATVSKAIKSVLQIGAYYLFVYEDGTASVRATLNGPDLFSRALTSYSNVSIRDVRILNGKLIFTGWYGTNQANSFVAYYDVSPYIIDAPMLN